MSDYWNVIKYRYHSFRGTTPDFTRNYVMCCHWSSTGSLNFKLIVCGFGLNRIYHVDKREECNIINISSRSIRLRVNCYTACYNYAVLCMRKMKNALLERVHRFYSQRKQSQVPCVAGSHGFPVMLSSQNINNVIESQIQMSLSIRHPLTLPVNVSITDNAGVNFLLTRHKSQCLIEFHQDYW